MPFGSSVILSECLSFHIGDGSHLCEANKRLNRSACGKVALIAFLWAQLEIQTERNWRHCWVCPQVSVERGNTWRWLFDVWSLSMFWGFTGKESQICMVGNLSFWEWPLSGLKHLEAAVLSAGFRSCLSHFTAPRLAYWQIILFPSLHRGPCLWPSEHLPRMCQVMNELYLRLSLKATAYISANCRTCQHNRFKAFSLLEPLSALSAASVDCLISNAKTINIYKP